MGESITSHFDGLKEVSPNMIWTYHKMCLEDTYDKKINLSIGTYKDENGSPYLFKAVQDAEIRLAYDTSIIKDYQPPKGYDNYSDLAQEVMFGDCIPRKEKRISSYQSIAGTGSLKLAAEFIIRNFKHINVAHVPKPTWDSHATIFGKSGFKIEHYPYYHNEEYSFKFQEMIDTLINTESNNAMIVLHLCGHNPTGVDPTQEEWKEIAKVIKEKNFLCLFDCAYQGFSSGDPYIDAWPVRHFADMGIELIACQSFSKNMGLYGERIGAVHVVCNDTETAKLVTQNMELVVASMYTSPPLHAAAVVKTILEDPELKKSWLSDLKHVAGRIEEMRHVLYNGLINQGTPGKWESIINQKGMFTFLPITEAQALRMIHHWHVYVLPSGRVSIASLNHHNINYMLDALDEAVRSIPNNE